MMSQSSGTRELVGAGEGILEGKLRRTSEDSSANVIQLL